MAVGFGEDERDAEPGGGMAHGAGHVAAAAEHRVRAALSEDQPRLARGSQSPADGEGSAQRIAPVEAADPQEVDLIPGGGHELGLRPLAGADERDCGALSAQRVGDGDRRNDVARRAAGRYHDSCHLLRAFSCCRCLCRSSTRSLAGPAARPRELAALGLRAPALAVPPRATLRTSPAAARVTIRLVPP